MSDSQTVTVSFIKDGKIIKSISDYADSSPSEFIWAYKPVMYLNQKIDLKHVKVKSYLRPQYMHGSFKTDDSYLALAASELFYLLDNFKTGKETEIKFNEKYILDFNDSISKKITTDGRYYKFYLKDKTTKTIDIGYDFLTNSLVYKFEKKYEQNYTTI